MKNIIFKFPSNYNSIPTPEIFFQDYFNTLSKLINGIDKNLIKKIDLTVVFIGPFQTKKSYCSI